MKNILASSRSRYIFSLAVFAIGIGVISKIVISYPEDCSLINTEEITWNHLY